MNPQFIVKDGQIIVPDSKIGWTNIFGAGSGYTVAFTGGCFHDCGWEMPDGTKATCYAADAAATVKRQSNGKFYGHGFRHHYWNPDRLQEPVRMKKPAGIFVDAMSDLLGHWVADEQIRAVFEVMWQTLSRPFGSVQKTPV